MSRPDRAPAYRPTPPDLWRPPAALAHMRRLLSELGDAAAIGTPFAAFLPPPATTPSPVQRRATLASTLLAGLKLARDGETALHQVETFGAVLVGRRTGMLALETSAA